jgi:hypothetical protein
MTDVEIAERTVASLTDKRDRAVQRSTEITVEKQKLAYAVHVAENKEAKAQLAKLNALDLAGEIESLNDALIQAKRLLVEARQVVGRAEAVQHFKKLHEQLDALKQMAEPLDLCLGTTVKGSMGGMRHEPGLKNPPLLDRCGECVGQIFLAMRAIDDVTGSDLRRGVSWPPGRWSKGHVADLRKGLEGVVMQYCGRVPSARNFSGLIDALVTAIKKAALAQHEQTMEIAA